MNFDYNSTRPKLILAEYGRNVQNMVDYICTVPSKDERNRLAQVVIDMMGVLNPHLRDVSDFKHKLWDHLYIISDFNIEVDSPYAVPTKEEIRHKPDTIPYPQSRIRFKHYGHIVENMIQKAVASTSEEGKLKMTLAIANFMKMAYLNWNKDSVNDLQILTDLRELSAGKLSLPEDTVLTKVDFKSPPPGSRVKSQQNTTNNNQKSAAHKKQHNNNNNNNNNNKKRMGHGSNNNNNKKSYQSNTYKK